MNLIAKLLLNSLYGRFGMDDLFTYTYIITKVDYPKFEKNAKDSILNVIDLGKSYLIQVKNPDVETKTALDNGFETHNINIGIASAVTAYARIYMSQFKNNPNYNLYYSDTDSIYIDSPLDDSLVSSTELGKMKLEGLYDEAIFLAPKVYALRNKVESIIKIKGLTKKSIQDNNITIDSLETLLYLNSNLSFTQLKWFKNIANANISVLEQIYTLKVTGNKRKLVYDSNNILIETVPFTIDINKKIK